MSSFSESLRSALEPFSPRRKYLVGVSAGRDSMALLHALDELGYRKLIVCHLNHGLRGAAAQADLALTRKIARKLGFSFERAKVNTKGHARASGVSVETAARKLRMQFFADCAKRHRCARLFLAHHCNDQVETMLFNFLRGSGAAGLGGMKGVSSVHRLEVIRPLLGVTRRAITEYVTSAKIPFREDASNQELIHTRNRLRHELIPLIEQIIGPSFGEAVLRAGDILREEDAWMAAQVPEVSTRLKCSTLRALPLALQRRLVLRWLKDQGLAEAGYQETARVLTLLNDGSGPAKVSLPERTHARRRAGEIFFERP